MFGLGEVSMAHWIVFLFAGSSGLTYGWCERFILRRLCVGESELINQQDDSLVVGVTRKSGKSFDSELPAMSQKMNQFK